ncbi:MAG: DNA alkylation repair protein [Bacteroidales bacterium]|nr:DNA alkylation repair protein [Bacteroidales bacterium]
MKPTEGNILMESMLSQRDAEQAVNLSRFFKTGKGQYGEGDRFLGVKVPVTRQIVKRYWRETSWENLEQCIRNEYHEVRLAALLVLVQLFKHARKDEAMQRRCIDFYLSHMQYVNNWDLVDLSCYELLGAWLLDKDRQLLYRLVADGRSIWEQRIGIVSTMAFIRHGELDDTYALADLFLTQPEPLHDLLQKAVGWLLREAGKRDMDRLRQWLLPRRSTMPRTMLRYAIEKFPEEERKRLLACGLRPIVANH